MDDRSLFTGADTPARPNRWRLLLAFFLMPPASALAAAAIFPVVWFGARGPDTVAPIAFLAGVMAVFVVLAGALPAFLAARRRGPITFSQTVRAGAMLGNLPLALLAFMTALLTVAHIAAGTISQHLSPLGSLVAGALRVVVLGTAVGAISAALFWLVGVKGTILAEGRPRGNATVRVPTPPSKIRP